MGALSEYVEERFGVKTRTIVNPVVTTHPGDVALVARENADRLMLLIVNLSAAAMYLGWDSETSDSRGILIDANGGFVSLVADDDGELVGYEAYVYSAAAGNIFVVETEAA